MYRCFFPPPLFPGQTFSLCVCVYLIVKLFSDVSLCLLGAAQEMTIDCFSTHTHTHTHKEHIFRVSTYKHDACCTCMWL